MINLSKEEAMLVVQEAISRGIAFVDDDYIIDSDGNELYNPLVNRQEAEGWLLDLLMGIRSEPVITPDNVEN